MHIDYIVLKYKTHTADQILNKGVQRKFFLEVWEERVERRLLYTLLIKIYLLDKGQFQKIFIQ